MMRKQVLARHVHNFSRPKPVRGLAKVFRFVDEEVQPRDPYLAEELRRQLRDFENRLNLSAVMKLAYPHGLLMYDIDSVAFKILTQNGQFRGIRPLGAFELKWKSERTMEEEGIPVNGMQYRALELFSESYGLPLFYMVNIAWKKVALWRIGSVGVRYAKLKEGLARDLYAVVPWEQVELVNPSALPKKIPEMLEGR